MKLSCSHITEQEKTLEVTEKNGWVTSTLNALDESPFPSKHTRNTLVKFSSQYISPLFMIKGSIQTQLSLLCSRCGKAFLNPYQFSFSTLYSQDPSLAGVGYLSEDSQKPSGTQRGFARHAHEEPSEKDSELDITYLQTEWIDLSALLTEQMRLETPLQPLCEPHCPGLCLQCGSPLSPPSCFCQHLKLPSESPFAHLRWSPDKIKGKKEK